MPGVLERAPGRGVQVAARHRGLRVGPGHRARLRRRRTRRVPGDIAILCRNTTEAINHLAYRLRLEPDDVVLTTVVEHHANLLPWGRVAHAALRRVRSGRHLRRRRRRGRPRRQSPRPRLLAADRRLERHRMVAAAVRHHRRRPRPGCPGGARRRPARPPPAHPGRGRLRGLQRPQAVRPLRRRRPRRARPPPSPKATPSWPAAGPSTSSTSTRCGGPSPPNARRPGRPTSSGPWPSKRPSTSSAASAGTPSPPTSGPWPRRLRRGLAAIDGVRVLGPALDTETLAIAAFVVEGVHHALVAARLSAEWGIGVRHGCFCAHPYLIRLLGLSAADVDAYREPGAARATTAACPGRCAPAAGSRAPRPTSTPCSTRCGASPPGPLGPGAARRLRPGPLAPATSGPSATRRGGGATSARRGTSCARG